ncbi:MAG: hypothetical protein ACOVQE_09100 [Chitinophagaceae bacterium]
MFKKIIFTCCIVFSVFVLKAQLIFNQTTYVDAKKVNIASFKKGKLVFMNGKEREAFISVETNANHYNGFIYNIAILDSLPTDSLTALKVKDVPKLYLNDSIAYVQFNGFKAVFQKVGTSIFFTRILYEDDYARITSLFYDSPLVIEFKTIQRMGYNSFLQFSQQKQFGFDTELIGIFNPRFAGRRSARAFKKYFNDYPELIEMIENKDFMFSVKEIIELLKKHKALKEAALTQ